MAGSTVAQELPLEINFQVQFFKGIAPRDGSIFRGSFHNLNSHENMISRDGRLNKTGIIKSRLSEAVLLREPCLKCITRVVLLVNRP